MAMTSAPTVSVIIPVYNRAHCLERAVCSVLQQTKPVDEIIIVDDGSTDDSVDLGRSLERWHERIKFYAQSNSGPAAARNLGIRHASKAWIAFLDSDDTWHPEKNELCIKMIEEYPKTILLHTAVWVNNGGNQHITGNNLRSFREDPIAMLSNFGIKTSSVMIPRVTIDAVGGFSADLRMCEDFDLFWRVILNGGRISYLERGLVEIFESATGLMASKTNIARYQLDVVAIRRVQDWATKRSVRPDFRSALDSLLASRVRAVLRLGLRSCDLRAVFCALRLLYEEEVKAKTG